MVAADDEALVVMVPRSKEKELAALAGFHALAVGLGKVGETILLKDDEGKACVEGGSYDALFAWRDAGRDKDCSAAG